LVLFIYVQSELMNVSAGVGYAYNQYSSLYTVTFFQRNKVGYFNPSRKFLSTTLIASMSTVIHQILIKKNSTKAVRFC